MEGQGFLEHASEIGIFNKEQGILSHRDYDIVEDIPAEIEEFVRLSRFGLIIDARNLFDQSLKEHLNLFPVLAEYADFLLEQDAPEAVKECSELLRGCLESNEGAFSEDEVQFLQLLGAFSDVRVRGNEARKFAIDAGRKWHRSCARTDPKYDRVDLQRDEVEIQGLEIYLAILVDAHRATRHWLRKEDYFLPGTQEKPTAGWSAFQSWFQTLNEEQRPWEAHKVLKSLLKVLDAGSMHQSYSEYIETLERFNQGDAYSVSRIAAANNYVAVSLERATSDDFPDCVRTENEKAYSLLLSFEDQGALHGHHFEQWKMNCSKLQELQLLETLDAGRSSVEKEKVPQRSDGSFYSRKEVNSRSQKDHQQPIQAVQYRRTSKLPLEQTHANRPSMRRQSSSRPTGTGSEPQSASKKASVHDKGQCMICDAYGRHITSEDMPRSSSMPQIPTSQKTYKMDSAQSAGSGDDAVGERHPDTLSLNKFAVVSIEEKLSDGNYGDQRYMDSEILSVERPIMGEISSVGSRAGTPSNSPFRDGGMAGLGGRSPRKSHPRSRKGCRTCKKRHIRCDETYPQCRNCTKYNCRCDYIDMPAVGEEPMKGSRPLDLMMSPDLLQCLDIWLLTGDSPLPELRSTDPLFWTRFSKIDLRLIHHIVTLSSNIHRRGYSSCTAWAAKMPSLITVALSHDFEMNALLALSASHLAWQTKNTNTKNLAYHYRGVALKGLHEAIGDFSRANSDAILAASMLLSWQATEWRSWASLQQGLSTVMSAMRPWAHESDLARYLDGERSITRARTPGTPDFPNATTSVPSEELRRIEEIATALHNLKLRLGNNEELIEHTGRVLDYLDQLRQDFPLPAPEEAFNRLQPLRDLIFWLPPAVLHTGESDLAALTLSSHLYATALALEPMFPEIGGAYLGTMCLLPADRIHEILRTRRNSQPQDSSWQVALSLVEVPMQIVAAYKARQLQMSRAFMEPYRVQSRTSAYVGSHMQLASAPAPDAPGTLSNSPIQTLL